MIMSTMLASVITRFFTHTFIVETGLYSQMLRDRSFFYREAGTEEKLVVCKTLFNRKKLHKYISHRY